MSRIDKKYRYSVNPLANKESIIQGDKYRFTVLTNKLVRLEYNENNIFEDRATRVVINRYFDKPDYKLSETEEKIQIITDTMILTYYKNRPFTASSLNIKFRGKYASPWNVWYYGEPKSNLKGTIRTLDSVSGEVPLHKLMIVIR